MELESVTAMLRHDEVQNANVLIVRSSWCDRLLVLLHGSIPIELPHQACLMLVSRLYAIASEPNLALVSKQLRLEQQMIILQER